MEAPRGGGVAALVLAGGSGTRMGPGANKVYRSVGGRPVLARSVAPFLDRADVDEVVVVVRAGDEDDAAASLSGVADDRVRYAVGGTTRYDSERAGLAALRVGPRGPRLVAIHDGARPFLGAELLDELLKVAERHGGAVPGLPVDEAVVSVAEERPRPVAVDGLVRVQTPQVFRTGALLAAYDAAGDAGAAALDTAEVVERWGDLDVRVVRGDPANVKLTTPEDLAAAEAVLAGGWSA